MGRFKLKNNFWHPFAFDEDHADFAHACLNICVPGMVAPPRPTEKQAAPPRKKQALPPPAPPRKIDEIRGAQRGKTDFRFH